MNLPNFQNLDSQDGKVYGRHNTVTSVNPYKCHFLAHYPDGNVVKGIDLFTTGWDMIPQGLSKLEYILSTGHKIEIPKYYAYMPLIEVSVGMDGSRIFHSINVKCLTDTDVLVYKIILRQDNISKYKIGDIIIGREKKPMDFGPSWKFTN